MGRIKRYASALRRMKRSHGHGVHSPFAYEFVTGILSPHYAYYAYATLDSTRRQAKHLASEPVASLKDAETIFRIAVKFQPRSIVQIGPRSGLLTTALALPDSRAEVTVVGSPTPCWETVTAPLSDRVKVASTIASDSSPDLALLCDCPDPETATKLIDNILSRQGVVICKGIDRSKALRDVWVRCCESMSRGMTFTNYKTGVAIGLKHLPRQHFIVWF